jgi:hypothetical protein
MIKIIKNDFGINTDLFTFVLRDKLKEKTCLCSPDRTVRLYVRLTSSENETIKIILSHSGVLKYSYAQFVI